MNPGAGNQYFPYEMGQKYPQYPPGWNYTCCLELTVLVIQELSAHLLQPQVLTRQNPFSSLKTAQCRDHPKLLRAIHLPRTRRLRTDGLKRRKNYKFNYGLKNTISLKAQTPGKRGLGVQRRFGKMLQSNKTADKCIQKMKYIIERYKNAKDWNKKQTGGSLRKSVNYNKVDKIL